MSAVTTRQRRSRPSLTAEPAMGSKMPLRPILLLALGAFALGTDEFVVAGLTRKIALTFGVSFQAAAQLITAFALTSGLLAPVFAVLVPRRHVRRTLLVGLAVFAAGNVLTAVALTLPVALMGRVLAGAGAASFAPLASTASVSLVTRDQRGRALALVAGGVSTATATGAPIGALIAGVAGWRAAIWFVVLITAVTWAGLAIAMPEIELAVIPRLRARLAPLANRGVCITLVSFFLLLLAVYLVYTYIGVAYDRALHDSNSRLALLLVVFGVAGLLSGLCSGWLTDRHGNRRVLNVMLVLAAIDFAIMPWTSATFATAIPAMAVWAATSWGQGVPQEHRLIEASPEHAGLSLALATSTVNVAIATSGLVGAACIALVGAHDIALISSALILASLAVAELFVTAGRGRPASVRRP